MPLGEKEGWETSNSKFCGVETDFSDDVPSLLSLNIDNGGFDFVLAHLMYKDNFLGKSNLDSRVSPTQWKTHVIGQVESLIDLDSIDGFLWVETETSLKQQVACANHLSLRACLLPTPPPPRGTSCANYARYVNQILQQKYEMELWLRIPLKKSQDEIIISGTALHHPQKDSAAKQFLILDLKEFRLCSLSLNLHGNPSLEVIGKLSLNDFHSNSAQTNIGQVSYCDGLLLCTIQKNTRLVVWNPCTGQTKWIQPRNRYEPWEYSTYTLGSYQDNKSRSSSYKILRFIDINDQEFEICDINSNSWRTLDGPDSNLFQRQSVSLKGKTYWLASDRNQENILRFLVSFDYTRERFERLSIEPFQIPSVVCRSTDHVVLSVVREEKLSLLLQSPYGYRKEIWVTNKIDETTAVTWIKILDYIGDYSASKRYFLVDEEKKAVLMCSEEWKWYNGISKYIYIVGEEDNKVLTEVDFGAPATS